MHFYNQITGKVHRCLEDTLNKKMLSSSHSFSYQTALIFCNKYKDFIATSQISTIKRFYELLQELIYYKTYLMISLLTSKSKISKNKLNFCTTISGLIVCLVNDICKIYYPIWYIFYQYSLGKIELTFLSSPLTILN